ncbi:MAG: ShET2/EspL2 family type III secretion system effector toxin, partial [Burkholderiales bacterium]
MAKITSGGKVDYQRYFTHTDQIENLAFSDNIWATKLTHLANIYHICSSDSFYQTIQAIFNRLRESKQNRRLGFMLLPSNLPSPHVLGIELKIKEKHGAIYCTINLYNPHATNTHIHLEGLAKDIPHLINSLKFKQNFLTNLYYECNQVDCFIVAECHNLIPLAQDMPLNDDVNITSYSNIKPEDELFIRLRHGLISKSFLDQLELAKNIHTYLRLGMGGYRFLYHAILNHNLDFLEYCTKIFQYVPSRYDDANCKTFLAATGKHGQPALYAIFTRNQSQLLKSYAKLLFQSQLPHYEITEIIAAANSKRYPGLFEAFRLNNLDVVLEYYNQVLESSLSQPQIVRLLVANSALNPSPNGATLDKEHTTKYATGLEVAFLVGNQRLVELVTELVLDSLLDDQAIEAILNAIGNGSAPGLHSAFKANQESVIQAYFHLILDSSLSENYMAKLIIAEDIDGNSAFSIIFSHNNINLFQQVHPIIIQASIQERLKEQILLATSGKTPSLHLAFQNKNFNLI